MNNKFALSFGISLVIVGLLNIFFETSNIILFGLSVSTTIFYSICFISFYFLLLQFVNENWNYLEYS